MYFAYYVGFACFVHFHFQCLEENMVHIMFLNLLKGKKNYNFAKHMYGHPVAFPLKDY